MAINSREEQMEALDIDFDKMTAALDKQHLMRLADTAISCMEDVLAAMAKNDGGDAYDFDGSMEEVDCAREAVDHYKGYLITGQK
jgi:hypothetical protein